MLNAQFRPVHIWPGKPKPDYARKAASFRAGYTTTLDLLEFELTKLGAKDIVIEAYFDLRDIRNDGWPKSSARPKQPGVIVSFASRKGGGTGYTPLSFPCDTYRAWEDNLRAIALALQALRAVDRYGVTRQAEQYRGWARIEPPAPKAVFASKAEAAQFVASGTTATAAMVMANEETRRQAYRIRAAKLHPDAAGGSHEEFVRLQAALEMLEK